ncbi:hypothetical protein ACH3XW_47505 [Acanthocheilonema viteae]
MRSVHTYFLLSYCFIVQFIAITITSAQEDDTLGEKRVMRNVLVRYDRSGIRNALVRFGKRMPDMYFLDAESRRGTGLKPSVEFDHFERSNHLKDILSKI